MASPLGDAMKKQAADLDHEYAAVLWDGTPEGHAASRLVSAAANLLIAAAEVWDEGQP